MWTTCLRLLRSSVVAGPRTRDSSIASPTPKNQRMAWHWNLGLGSSEVIENGAAINHIPYDFLLVGHCNYSSILYHFWVIWSWIVVTFKCGLQVTQTGTIRKLGCIVTVALSCLVCKIYLLIGWKSQNLYTHLYLAPPQVTVRISQKCW